MKLAEVALRDPDNLQKFERCVLPHLDAAYNLARWLTRDESSAQDVVQEAYLRAFRFFDGFHGGDAKSWLLAIVRNACFTWLQQNRGPRLAASFDEELHSLEADLLSPETALQQSLDHGLVRQAMEDLPAEYREVMVLRELEDLSYKEIASIAAVPIGTVMSRLARARKRLQQSLSRPDAPQRIPT